MQVQGAGVAQQFKQSAASTVTANERPERRTFWLFSGSE